MSLSGMVESPRQPDVIKKILQHLEKRQGFGLVLSPPAPGQMTW
jgi:hypothetical protein